LGIQKNHNHTCYNCGLEFTTKKKTRKYCSQSCAGKVNATLVKNHRGNTNSGENHWNWQGGGTINTQGYREIPLGKTNKKILEHRLVMAQYLGRELDRQEHVHHINGDKIDNRIENLVLLTPSEHQKLHLARRWHGLTTLV